MPKLEQDLSSQFTFHNAAHTLSVISSVEHIAMAEAIVSSEEITMLKTAALFHDLGFLIEEQDHEQHSCDMAKKYLPYFDYKNHEIEQICRMIMATKMPQKPLDRLSEILCDADLYYLGTKQYYDRADSLHTEFMNGGHSLTKEEWNLMQYNFLSNHHYFTTTANTECNKNKEYIINGLKSELRLVSKDQYKLPEFITDAIIILMGVIIAALALKGFLIPNHFFDGGLTGISLLTYKIYHFPLPVIIFFYNLPFIIVSYFSVSKIFAIKTFSAVIALGIFLVLMPELIFTYDKLLISIFGGVFLGLGIGLVMRGGGALDGLEVLALYTLKKTSFTIAEIILGLNIIIFSLAALNFGIETALYSILTYFCATQMIDYVVQGIQAYSGVTIVSGRSEEIKYQLVENLGRGITIYKGERGYLPGKFNVHAPCDLVFTVVTRLELRKLKNMVYDIDPKAFVFVCSIKETLGGVLKKVGRH